MSGGPGPTVDVRELLPGDRRGSRIVAALLVRVLFSAASGTERPWRSIRAYTASNILDPDC